MPALRVDATLPPEVWCGVARPLEGGERFALRLQIDARASRDDDGCPLTIDLFRSERVIDIVVVYPARSYGGGVDVEPTGLRPAYDDDAG
jgi:hypothetical protein